jgi:hypothetical protein
MAAKGQTHAKREREVALKERRERKRAKKAEAAAQRTAGDASTVSNGGSAREAEAPASEWIQ